MEILVGLWIGVPIGFVLCALLSGAKSTPRPPANVHDRIVRSRSGIRWPHSLRSGS